MNDEQLIISLEKVSSNLYYMLLDDAFEATKEERDSEITETALRLRSCIDALKLRLNNDNNCIHPPEYICEFGLTNKCIRCGKFDV